MPGHRPYANDPDAPPSVTQVVGALDKPGLSWAAARETANFAVRHTEAWDNLPVTDAVSKLYRHHRGVWDHRALIGTALHTVNAEWCQGRAVRVKEVVRDLRDRSALWKRKTESELYAEILPMADGLSRFWLEYEPQTLSWEQVVRYDVGNADVAYVGTLDWRADIGGRPLVLDLKTTGTGHGKGKYWDAWRLQLAAYRYATEAVVYDDDNVERGVVELPEAAGAAVVHLYKDGTVQFHHVKAGPREHEIFLALRRVYGWRKVDGQGMGTVDMAQAFGGSLA